MKSNDLVEKRIIKKVAILGAGASADAGAPILNNFWDKVEEFIKENKFDEGEIKKFKSVIEKRDKLLPNSDIEEFFSYVDFQTKFDVLIPTPALVRSIDYRIINKKNEDCTPIITELQQMGNQINDFIQLKNDIAFLISRTLDIALRNTDPSIRDCYVRLIENFDVTISFNWDILYEYAYNHFKGESISNYPKKLGFNKFELCKPALLKLHGSLSWGKCKNCGLYMSDSKIEHLIYGKNMACPSCNQNKLQPISILPALTKFENISTTRYPPFRNMWYCAMHAITEAKEIYFFGYSLSDKDIHTKIFLRSGIMNNLNSNLVIYVIYKENETDPSKDKELEERYKEAFGKKVNPTFIKKSFKDYFVNNQKNIN